MNKILVLFFAICYFILPINAQIIESKTNRTQDSLELVKLQKSIFNNVSYIFVWDLTKPIKTWRGIKLDSTGCCVEEINLLSAGMQGTIPSELTFPALKKLNFYDNYGLIGDFPVLNTPKLEALTLSNTGITGTLNDLTHLPNLRILRIESTKIKGNIPNFNCPLLEEINLRFNKLEGTIPSFDKCPKLKSIDLWANNQLSGSIPKFKLNELETLILIQNRLTGEIPLFETPKLKNLLLGINQLSGNLPQFNMPELRELDVSRNLLTGEIPTLTYPKLVNLYLNYNKFTGKFPNIISKDIRDLFLSGNQLSGNLPNLSFPLLTQLGVDSNMFDGAIPNFNLPKATTIWLRNNKFSGCIPEFFKSYCNTVSVNFDGNPNLEVATFEEFCATGKGLCVTESSPKAINIITYPVVYKQWEYNQILIEVQNISNSEGNFSLNLKDWDTELFVVANTQPINASKGKFTYPNRWDIGTLAKNEKATLSFYILPKTRGKDLALEAILLNNTDKTNQQAKIVIEPFRLTGEIDVFPQLWWKQDSVRVGGIMDLTFSYYAYHIDSMTTHATVWLSKDDKLDANDIQIQAVNDIQMRKSPKSIEPLWSKQVNVSATIPSNIVSGDYFFLIQTDPDNLIVELNEKNNIEATAFKIYPSKTNNNANAVVINSTDFYTQWKYNFVSIVVQNTTNKTLPFKLTIEGINDELCVLAGDRQVTTSRGKFLYPNKWDIGNLAPNETAKIDFYIFHKSKLNDIKLLATLDNGEEQMTAEHIFNPKPLYNNNTSDIEVSIATDKTDLKRYDFFTYTVTAKNIGKENAENVSINAYIPDKTIVATEEKYKPLALIGNIKEEKGFFNWFIPSLEVGQSETFQYTLFTLEVSPPLTITALLSSLKQTDLNSFNNQAFIHYRTLSRSSVENAEKLKLYPTISKDEITIEKMSDIEETAQFHLFDGTGKMLQQFNMALNKGLNIHTLDVLSLRSGIYYILESNAFHKKALRFIKVSE